MRWLRGFGLIELAILVGGLITISTAWYANERSGEALLRTRELDQIVDQIRAEVVDADAILSQADSRTVSPPAVTRHYDAAATRCGVLLGGGELPGIGTVAAIGEPGKRAAVVSFCDQVALVREAALRRLDAGRGTAAVREYTAAFVELVDRADEIEDALVAGVQVEETTLDRILGARIAFLTVLTLGVIAVASRRRRKIDGLRSQYESILGSANDGIYGIDLGGKVTFANPAATQLTGHAEADIVGADAHALFHHSRPDGTPFPLDECPIMLSLHEGSTLEQVEDTYWRADGTSFPTEYSARPILDENGEVAGSAVVFRDITERRELERLQSEFVSVVSHELRTPLTSIHGALGLLNGGAVGDLSERARRMVEVALGSTERLVRLINDILDIERLESGRAPLDLTQVRTQEVVARAVAGISTTADQAEVTIDVAGDDLTVWADPDRLEQTLVNLLSNAIKFSPTGETVRVAVGSRDGEATFTVSDRGRGIPADKLETIFGRFQQVDASDSRQRGGTGLGLAISRSIVEQHGGRIWVESRLGVGSEFCFTIPLVRAPLQRETSAPSTRPRILVVDDDPRIRDAAVAALGGGFDVITASNGAEGLRKARLAVPDAIVLDLIMPGMDGWDVAAALKEDPQTAQIPILVMSVLHQDPEDPRTPAGARWLGKPLQPPELVDALERLLGEGSSTLLVIEDDEELGGVLQEMFDAHDVTTYLARTANETLEACRRYEPDAIILDLMLPDGDGFEIVEWLRQDGRLRRIPLVVYTARDLDEADRARLRLGDTEFFTKSRVSPDVVRDRVVALLARMVDSRLDAERIGP